VPNEFPDIVVLIPGITGSVLERNGREVWGISIESVLRGLLSGGQSVQDLRLDHDDPEADDLGDGVRATRLVNDVHLFPGLWAIDGYTKVAARLRQRLRLSPGDNYYELPYDWRRDNRVAARTLQRESVRWLARRRATHPDTKLVLVAHSMGGLVSRYFLEVLGGWRDTRALITFGTPYRGSLNALDSLVNGVRKAGVVDLTELTRSFTSIYQLLPIYPCLDVGAGALVRLCEADTIPRLNQKQLDHVRAAEAFHRQIEKAVQTNQASVAAGTIRYAIRPVVGIDQPTSQTAITRLDAVELLRSRNGTDESGDGTVPRVSATPIEKGEGQAAFAAARHGSLQNTDAVLAHVQGVLTAPRDLGNVRAVGAPITLSLDIDGIFARQEPIRFAVKPSATAVPLQLAIESINGMTPAVSVTLAASDDEWVRREVPPLPAGVYRMTVTGDASRVEPASEVFAVA
jgi:pimeloyl-ACP methyl ester carboxylesterase